MRFRDMFVKGSELLLKKVPGVAVGFLYCSVVGEERETHV